MSKALVFQKRKSAAVLAGAVLLACWVAPSLAAPADLPQYEVKIDSAQWRELERGRSRPDQTYPASFVANGKEYAVKMRLRGSWARSWPKKSFKIFFEEGKEFEGNHCLNLNSAWRDPALVREPLAYHVFAACAVPASRTRMVSLRVNGQFYGLYVDVEQPDKPLLKRHRLQGAAIYKANSPSNRADERDLGSEKNFAAHYEKETRKSESHADLQQFCRALAAASNEQAFAFFTNRVLLDTYVNYLAANVLVQNWDGLNKNHFLVHDERGSGQWLAVPWDLDRTLGDHWDGDFDRADVPILLGQRTLPSSTGWNRLADRFFSDATLRGRFLDRLEELLRTEFTPAKLFPLLDRYEAQLAGEAPRDQKRWGGAAVNLHQGIADVKRFIERRRRFVQDEIKRLRAEGVLH